jgi:5-methylcytosine-specific restriction enzyme B
MVDYALRRRFAFVPLSPRVNSPAFASFLASAGATEDLIERLQRNVQALNEQIASDIQNLGPGYQIGHSYFCALPKGRPPDTEWYTAIVRSQVEPLLREYWFDQREKVQAAMELLLS